MLDQRTANLLKLIVTSKQRTIKQLEHHTNCSRRQIYYDLEKINDWLATEQLPPIKNIRARGLSVTRDVKDRALKVLPTLLAEEMLPSNETRESMICLQLFLKSDYLSLHHLTDYIRLSRNTVLSTVKLLKSEAVLYGVQLRYNRQDGYYVDGDEFAIRTFVTQKILILLQQPNGAKLLEEAYEERMGRYSFSKTCQNIKSNLKEFEDRLCVSYVEESMEELSMLLATLLARAGMNTPVKLPAEMMEAVNHLPDFKEIKRIVQRIQGSLEETEQIYFAMQIMGLNLRYDHHHDVRCDHGDLSQVLNQILIKFEALACVTFTDRSSVYDALYLHLKPAYYRLLFNIPVANPHLRSIKKEYGELFTLVKKSVTPLESLVGKDVPEDEIGYLTLHFGAFIQHQNLPYRKNRAIIVCPNGIGTSNMIKHKLQSLVPEIEIIRVMSIREFKEHEGIGVDFVFSTVPLETTKPVIIVHPVLSAVDQARVLQEVDTLIHRGRSSTSNIDHLMQVIKMFTTVHDEEALYSRLNEVLLKQGVQKIGGYRPVLKQLLTEPMIQMADRVPDWKEAIRLSASPLLKEGMIDERYIDAMIMNVEKLGAYIVLAPKVAVPHARPEDGVVHVGMSLLKLHTPVSFGEGKMVSVVIVLAAIDNETHLKALSQLSNLLEEERNIDRMENAREVESLLELIGHYS
ncbi:BglG family transcription antiterminator [Rossellomorea marisflavi]|uniref:BglG family transcription antiterminator n=1 Tax=Rossellomorea marisflavi TaxID=189381 RepID=UPI003458BF14